MSIYISGSSNTQMSVDSTPTQNSTNLVTSGGVYTAINNSSSGSVKFGTYVGTGNFGSSSKNSITCDFVISAIIFLGFKSQFMDFMTKFDEEVANYVIDMSKITTTYTKYNAPKYVATNVMFSFGAKSSNGKTFYWYNTNDAASQLNTKSTTYYYLAIG